MSYQIETTSTYLYAKNDQNDVTPAEIEKLLSDLEL